MLRHSLVPDSLWPRGLQPTRLLRPWDSPGKNTGVGCHFLLQGIFPTQGSSLHLAWRVDSLPLEPPGKPFILINNFNYCSSSSSSISHFSSLIFLRTAIEIWIWWYSNPQLMFLNCVCAQLYLTLCDSTDYCSLQGFSVHGIFQARILEWVAISFSRGSS